MPHGMNASDDALMAMPVSLSDVNIRGISSDASPANLAHRMQIFFGFSTFMQKQNKSHLRDSAVLSNLSQQQQSRRWNLSSPIAAQASLPPQYTVVPTAADITRDTSYAKLLRKGRPTPRW